LLKFVIRNVTKNNGIKLNLDKIPVNHKLPEVNSHPINIIKIDLNRKAKNIILKIHN